MGYPGSEHADKLATWPEDDEARVVARLKSGRRVTLPPNSGGRSLGEGGIWHNSSGIDFDLTAHEDAAYRNSGAPNSPKILLSEVQAFEIETRGYGDPVYVVAKLP